MSTHKFLDSGRYFGKGVRYYLVVDYVDGATYKDLFEQRLQQGQCFSETEILELFKNLLPVLSYLHIRGVIHRDISPDNIILRTQDRLPILIDLGGVKQVAIQVGTQIETEQNPIGAGLTCLGKVGYSPDEQLRYGLVAPHSDLYALAVTALVLYDGEKAPAVAEPRYAAVVVGAGAEAEPTEEQKLLNGCWHKSQLIVFNQQTRFYRF